MKVDRSILGGAAAVQFGSLALVTVPQTRSLGLIIGIITGAVLLLLAFGVQPGVALRLGRRSGT